MPFLLCLVPAHGGGAPPTAENAEPLFKLSRGIFVEREIANGGVQLFEFTLSAGQYLQLSIVKGDLNISVTIYGPAGQKLVEHESHCYEELEVSVVAVSAGVHRMDVRSLERGQGVRRFGLKVEQARPASALDERAYAASCVFAEASRLLAQWEAESLQQAVLKFKEAEHGWRLAGHTRSAIRALMKAADIHFMLGKYGPALEVYKEAAAQSRRGGERELWFESLSHTGRLYSSLGDSHKAQTHLRRALEYYQRLDGTGLTPDLKHAYAETLAHIGEVHYSKGRLNEAAEALKSALAISSEIGDRGGAARVRLFIGYVSTSSGETEAALAEFQRAVEIYRALADPRGEALALTALGSLHSMKGEEQSALGLHLDASRIFRRIGDRQSEAVTLNGLAQVYEDLNEKQAALDTYKQALELFAPSRSPDPASVVVYQIARVYRDMGDIERALEYYGKCVRLSRAAKKTRMEAYALNDIAAIYASQGKRQQTLYQYQELLRLYKSIGDRRGQVIARNSIGEFFSLLKRPREALRSYREALRLSRGAGDRELEISTLYNVSRAARDCGDLEDALAHVKQSLDLIELLRAYVASPEMRSSFFASVRKHYELHIDLLMQLERLQPGRGFAGAALSASESARARSLLEILAEAGADIRRGTSPDLMESERTLQQLLADVARRQMQSPADGQKSAEAAREINRLITDYHVLQSRMREQNPRYAALAPARPLRLEEIQNELRGDEDALLLEYALGEERSYLWAVTSDSLDSYELPGRATLEGVAREVYALLTARQKFGEQKSAGSFDEVATADRAYSEKARELSDMLLGPAASRLGRRRLLIIAEGVLQYIPFDALPALSSGSDSSSESPLMLSRHEIVYLPSISTLAAIRRERRSANPARKVVAVLADPVFEKDDPRVENHSGESADASGADREKLGLALRDIEGFNEAAGIPRLYHTLDEAQAILDIASPTESIAVTGFGASRATLMSPQLADYQVIHFATHGLINSEHPELSSILLSMIDSGGRRDNGVIQLHDIYSLNLSAELVVLSACNTGLGKEVKGEGLVGLTRGLMYAGSKGVVASLWKVDDRATAELMGHFYKAMLKDQLPPAAALRAAKEALRKEKRWRAPYYWAGFVLQGEYRQRVGNPVAPDHFARLPVPWPLPLLLLACLLSGVYLLKRRRSIFTRGGLKRSGRPAERGATIDG